MELLEVDVPALPKSMPASKSSSNKAPAAASNVDSGTDRPALPKGKQEPPASDVDSSPSKALPKGASEWIDSAMENIVGAGGRGD